MFESYKSQPMKREMKLIDCDFASNTWVNIGEYAKHSFVAKSQQHSVCSSISILFQPKIYTKAVIFNKAWFSLTNFFWGISSNILFSTCNYAYSVLISKRRFISMKFYSHFKIASRDTVIC